MNSMNREAAWRLLRLFGALSGLLVLTTMVGCPGTGGPIRGDGSGNGNGDGNDNTGPEFGILNFRSDISFSDDVVLTVLYSVPSTFQEVVGFVQLLNAPASVGGTPIGVEEIIATDLPVGQEQSFLLDTSGMRPGFYQVGVRANGTTYLSTGTMEIQGAPAPLFLEPSSDRTFTVGDFVPISADVGDPQGVAQWRLFYQSADDPLLEEGQAPGGQLLGRRIDEGIGNTVDARWDTRNISTGDYRFGLSATDIGLTIAGAVQAGRADAIVTEYSDAVVTLIPPPESARPPVIEILVADATAFGGDAVEVPFTAQTFEGDDYVVTFFFIIDDDQTTFATVTDRDVSSVTFADAERGTEELASGVYAIGATISDGLNEVVEVPTASRLLVNVVQADAVSLTVSQPGESQRVAQGDTVDIAWTTNVPPGRGTIDVFARQVVDPTNEVDILSDVSTSVSTAEWTTTNEAGLYEVFVRLTVTDPPLSPITSQAPGTIRVSLTAPQFWMGQIGLGRDSTRQGEVFQGVNFQDNAGPFLASAGDLDRDGKADFLIGARYGKPFFQNPNGVGIGEAYMIFGDQRRNETRNLNAVSLAEIKGVALPGPRTRDGASTETDGLSSMRLIPDQDGDNLPELAFGFPFTDSRGHSKNLYVDRDPFASSTLERSQQFMRGGVVFVSSRNRKLSNPPAEFTSDPAAALRDRPVIYLDLVGQNFSNTTPSCTGHWVDLWTLTVEEDNAGNTESRLCERADVAGDGDGCPETYRPPAVGFNRVLATGVSSQCRPFSEGSAPQNAGTGADCECFDDGTFQCAGANQCALGIEPVPEANATNNIDHSAFPPFNLRQCVAALGIAVDPILPGDVTAPYPIEDDGDLRTGSDFYPLALNVPSDPFGARIIGASAGTPGLQSTTGDKYGSSIAVSGGFLLISAPNREPVAGEVTGASANELDDNGLVYLFNMNNLWPDWTVVGGSPPLPFQYQMGRVDPATGVDLPSQCGRDQLLEVFPSPFRVMGEANQNVEFVEGCPDFNLDGREDFVVGAPRHNDPDGDGVGDGVVYVSYRRDPNLEGDYLLSKISLDPLDVERLAGLRVNGKLGAQDGFGEVIARSLVVTDESGRIFNETIDFNGDGLDDIIIGNPNANAQRGEVVIIFATLDLISPAGGYDLDTLVQTLVDDDGGPRAVRIVGRAAGDQFGFNAAVIGDFNGDGANDLLIAAPGASPMFDSDDNGTLDTAGIDVSSPDDPFGDGIPDDTGGTDDLLTEAGEVYLILGATADYNNLVDLVDTNREVSIETLGSSRFRGLVFVGRQARDALGGGIESKRGQRSFGLGGAGDVDGDGRDDILIGSILADPGGRNDAGEAYLIYGFGL